MDYKLYMQIVSLVEFFRENKKDLERMNWHSGNHGNICKLCKKHTGGKCVMVECWGKVLKKSTLCRTKTAEYLQKIIDSIEEDPDVLYSL